MEEKNILQILFGECQKGRFIKKVEHHQMTDEDAGVARVVTVNEDAFFKFINPLKVSFNRTSNNEFIVMC